MTLERTPTEATVSPEEVEAAAAGMIPERALAEGTVGEELRSSWEEKPGLIGFLSTVNHKRIGRRYLVTAGFFFMLAGIQALVMRTQLISPDNSVVSPETYDQLFSLHGTAMIFFFATPMNNGFGNFFLPLMVGTRDMAFPRLNALSYWIFLLSGLVMFASFPLGMAPDGGWFAYVPLSRELSGHGLDFYTLGLLLLAISSTVGAINLIVTALKMRAPGMNLARVPVFVWAVVTQSFMLVFALPPLDLANAMLFADRRFGTNFFVEGKGGDTILWQHLFWLFGHPDVYIIVLPALGIVSSVVPVFSRRPIAAYPFVVLATVATGIISFGVWVHHMFAVGISEAAESLFAAATLTISLPAGIQMFAWIATMWRGRVVLTTAMLYALSFVAAFVVGGVTGVMFAVVPFDQQVTDSYFVVAHFHYVLFGGAVLPLLAGLFYWWPKMTGRTINETAGKWSFALVFTAFNLTFFPMHVTGLDGMPRRIYTYGPDLGWTTGNVISTIGSYLLGAGFLLTLGVFVESLLRDRWAPDDPWGGNTLEWLTASPPEEYNFPVVPTVHSLNPLWDGQSVGSMTTHRHDEMRTMVSEHHRTLRTSELDGRIETVMTMPGETTQPLWLAVCLTATFVFLLAGWYVAAGVAVGLAAVVAAIWMWHRPDAEQPEEAVAPGRSTGWWAMVLFIATEAATFAAAIASYLYLRFSASGPWPPTGDRAPSLLLPTVATAVLVVSCVPMALTSVTARLRSRAGTFLAVLTVAAAGVAFVVLQILDWLSEWPDSTLRKDAYGSLLYSLTGLHTAHVVLGIGLLGFLLVSLGVRKEVARPRGPASLIALYWYFMAAVAVAVYLTVYLSPHL
jgi:cytochrome c oxidase subunit 1/cytochrome c oxidase subunit I+III